MSDEIEEYRAVANALASWSDGPLAGDARKAITALIGMYETQASKLDTWQKALDSMRQERYHFSTELKAAESRLDTLQKNYDLGQAALALAESEGKEVASRWATAVKLLEKAERERSEARSRLVSVETELDEASPMRTCARCGKQDRSHRMAIEEGDEWECFPCWERCNAQERAALAVEEQEPISAES